MPNFQRIVVAAVIVRNRRIFLAKRSANKRIAPGKWHLPGGHVEFGEQPEEALMRELDEEFGIRARIGPPIHAFSYLWGDSHSVGIAYRARFAGSRSSVRWNPRDTEAVAWVGLAELDSYLPVGDHNRIAAEMALNSRRHRHTCGSHTL